MPQQPISQVALYGLQRITLFGLILISLALIGSCIAAAVGVLPWLSISANFDGTAYPNAGQHLQIFTAVLTTALIFFVPLNRRVMQLERTHRDFQIGMDDVAQAFYLCHTADREGAFTLSAEFDAVRERLAFMRNHPDMQRLEPSVLEIAAQMSQQSRELAEVYSTENVERARDFLRQRQTEVDSHQEEIAQAVALTKEIKAWHQAVQDGETQNDLKIEELDKELKLTLAPLGYSLSPPSASPMSKIAKIHQEPWPAQA